MNCTMQNCSSFVPLPLLLLVTMTLHKHPEVVRSIQKGVELVSRKGKFSGGFVPQSKDDIKWLLDMGMRFITYEVDSSMIQTHVGGITDWFHEEANK